jgi:hypothetical protein
MYELHDYRFSMILQGGWEGDVWALGGRVFGKPGFDSGDFIHVSTPVAYDPVSEVVTTRSGSKYKLVNPEILDTIERGGYSTH